MDEQSKQWAESAHRVLAADGRRTGGARARVVDVLAQTGGGLSAQAAFDLLAETHGAVAFSSVYRSLAVLAEVGAVRAVTIAGTLHFDLVHPDGGHAHHVVCDECHKTESFVSHQMEEVIHDVAAATPYVVRSHDVILHGLCPDCAPLPARAARIDDAPEPLA